MNSLIQGYNSYLDVGCGEGSLVRNISYRGDVRCCGIDISKVAVAAGIEEGLELQQGSVTAIPFPDNSFDFVTCFDVLEHLHPDESEQALSELVRVSKQLIGLQICTNRTINGWPEIIPCMHPNVKTKPEWKKLIMQQDVCQLYYGEHKSHVHFLLKKGPRK